VSSSPEGTVHDRTRRAVLEGAASMPASQSQGRDGARSRAHCWRWHCIRIGLTVSRTTFQKEVFSELTGGAPADWMGAITA